MLWEREGSPYCRRRRVIHAVVEGGFSVLWEREGSPCCGRESVLHAVGERVFFMLWEREGSSCCGRGRVLHALSVTAWRPLPLDCLFCLASHGLINELI